MNRWILLGTAALLAAAPPAAAQFRLPLKLSELEARAKADSNDAAAHYNVALGYWNAKRWEDAEREFRLAVAIEPQFAEGWLALSRLPFARRLRLWEEIAERRVSPELRPQVEEAYRLYQRAILINPLVDLRTEAAARPARSAYWMASEQLEQLYEYLFGGFDDIETGNYAAAYNRFNRLIEDAPTRADREALPDFVYYFRGLAAGHIGRWDDAIRDFKRLFDLSLEAQSPDSLLYYIPIETNQYRYMLGVLHQRAGRLHDAAYYYSKALDNDIGLYMAHARLAEMYEAAQMWDQAIVSRRNAVNANPEDASLLLDLGKTLANTGRLADAVGPLHQAAEMNPRDARIFFYLGAVLQQLNRKDDARSALTRFISLAPSRYDRQIANAKQLLASLQ